MRFFLFLLILLPFLPTAQAAHIDVTPPEIVTVTVVRSNNFQTGPGLAATDFLLFINWTRSPSDPGNWVYHVNASGNGNGILNVDDEGTPISNRARWLTTTIGGSFDEVAGFLWSWSIRAQTGDHWSEKSCAPTVDIRKARLHNPATMTEYAQGWAQCGNTGIYPGPSILDAQVNQPLTVNTGNTLFRFNHITPDTNESTSGDFRYDTIAQFTSQGNPSTTVAIPYLSPPNSGNAGIRWQNISYAGTSPFYITLSVRATDLRTGLHGNFSCDTTFDTRVLFSTNRCGLHVTPKHLQAPANPSFGEPSLPFLDIPSIVSGFGMTNAKTVGYAFAAVIIAALAFIGYKIGKSKIAYVGAILGIGSSVTLGLFETWLLIILFAFALLIIVLKRSQKEQ